MDLFPTLLEEYDLRKAPGLDNFKKHIKEQGKTSGHSLAVNGVSSHGGWDPLEDKSCIDIMNVFHQCIDDYNFNGNFIESQAFAYLAIRSYLDLPISFPNTTRCEKAISGGEVFKNF